MTLYEMEFKETRALATYKYRKYNIYAYQQDFGDNIHYTFWYGDKDNEYISSIPSLIEAQLRIDECFISKFKKDLEPLKGIKYKDGSYYGDFIYGDKKFLSNFDESNFDKNVLMLNNLEYNTFATLLELNIDVDYFDKFKYDCPFTKQKYYSVVPIAIVSDDLEKYFQSSEYSKLKDDLLSQDFLNGQKKYFNKNVPMVEIYRNSITIALMGAGFTYSCYPNDGEKCSMLSQIPLENGDIVICVNYIWFNK